VRKRKRCEEEGVGEEIIGNSSELMTEGRKSTKMCNQEQKLRFAIFAAPTDWRPPFKKRVRT